jgi:hypothetical protein
VKNTVNDNIRPVAKCGINPGGFKFFDPVNAAYFGKLDQRLGITIHTIFGVFLFEIKEY